MYTDRSPFNLADRLASSCLYPRVHFIFRAFQARASRATCVMVIATRVARPSKGGFSRALAGLGIVSIERERERSSRRDRSAFLGRFSLIANTESAGIYS